MDLCHIAVLHSTYDVVVDGGSLLSLDLDLDQVAVLDAGFLCLIRSEVGVSLGNDHTVLQVDFTLRSDDLASRGTGHIARLSDRSLDADLSAVGQRKLKLRIRPHRSQHADTLECGLGSDDVDSLLGSELSRLYQILHGQLVALSEQCIQILLVEMNVFVGSVALQFVAHDSIPLFS